MKEEFENINELYKRVYPALKSKVSELKKQDYIITEEEIWKILSNKWKDSNNLTLFDIVDDILKIKITDLENNRE